MGYTHYWQNDKIDSDIWSQFVSEVKLIAAEAILAGIKLGDYQGNGGEPDFNEKDVAFNGVGSESCESFIVLNEEQLETYSFCKTNGQPYDAVVTAILIRAKELFKDDFLVKSDGTWEDWQGGRILYETVFGTEPLEPNWANA